MTDEIKLALTELQEAFPDAQITSKEDGSGGAFVVIDGVSLGCPFTEEKTWFGFQIPYNYPHADIYPHYTAPNLQLEGGKALGGVEGIGFGASFEGINGALEAIQLSRRTTNNSQPMNATAKLMGVREWLLNL